MPNTQRSLQAGPQPHQLPSVRHQLLCPRITRIPNLFFRFLEEYATIISLLRVCAPRTRIPTASIPARSACQRNRMCVFSLNPCAFARSCRTRPKHSHRMPSHHTTAATGAAAAPPAVMEQPNVSPTGVLARRAAAHMNIRVLPTKTTSGDVTAVAPFVLWRRGWLIGGPSSCCRKWGIPQHIHAFRILSYCFGAGFRHATCVALADSPFEF